MASMDADSEAILPSGALRAEPRLEARGPSAGQGPAGTRPPPRRDRLLRIAAPQRRSPGGFIYSAFVGLMKWLLPGAAICIVILVAVWPDLAQIEQRKFRIGDARVDLSNAQHLAMLNPRFQGMDDRAQSYNIRSIAATQSPSDPQLVELDQPDADLLMTDSSLLKLIASTGLYDRTNQVLDLFGGVTVVHDAGHEFQTATARLDVRSSDAYGESPVSGHGPMGTIESRGFRIVNKGEVVVFTGRSTLVLHQGGSTQAKRAAQGQKAARPQAGAPRTPGARAQKAAQ